ncbi:MAG: hypothetical protein ACJAVI_000494 [Candidatus Azotimanducaceae bacterium]|jgi:hypothetical protein
MDIQTKRRATLKIDIASVAAIGFFILYITAGVYSAMS